MIKIGVIGYKNHAKRMIKIFSSQSNVKIQCVYHPKKKIKGVTNNINYLLNTDAILILCPNHLHFKYINFVKKEKYKGYIFCEKPPVTSKSDLKRIKCNKRKTFFNFNFRFSYLKNFFEKEINLRNLGKVLNISIVATHGFAFKKEYKNSWRSKSSLHKNGITETVIIHWIDFINLFFGEINKISYNPVNFLGNGTAYDTCQVSLKLKNKAHANIFASYASPAISRISIIYTNGIIEYDKNLLKVYGPRNVFSKDGKFKNPPIIFKKKINYQAMYNESLINSVNYFLNFVRSKKYIPRYMYDKSIEANKFVFMNNEK